MGQDRIKVTPELIVKLKAVKRHLKDSGRKGFIKWSHCIEHLFQDNKDLKQEVRELKAGQPEGISTAKEQTPTVDPIETHQCPHYTFDPAIERVQCSKDFNKGGRVHKIPQEVCDKHWEEIKKTWTEQDVTDVECLCRFEDRETFFCVKNPPHVKKLPYGLKVCNACPDKLSKEKAEQRGLILRTHNYVTCGGKEVMDEKVGLQIYCEKEGGRWVTTEHCKKVECDKLKTVKTT